MYYNSTTGEISYDVLSGGALISNGNSNVNIPAANGNISMSVAGNTNVVVVTGTGVNVAGTLNATGNANVGNLGTGGLIAATGNVSGGNFTTVGVVEATGNIITSANIVTDFILGKTNSVTIAAAGTNQDIELKPSGTGVVDVWGAKISNLATPVASTDAATKDYVDQVAQGLHTHAPVAAATPDTLANVTSGTITYNNGTSGVGATLTTTGSYTTIDGVNIASSGTRILVKNEANAAHNGIYTYTSSTVITRATDFDTPTEMAGGDFTFVQNGTLYNDTGWVMADPVTTVGTTAVNWIQFSGAGTYTAGTGLTLNGTQFSISNTTVTANSYGNGDVVATFTVNSQGQITSAANTAITANAANLTGTTLASSIVTSSLTTVGTLGSLSVTGNITSGNANLGNLVTANFFTGTLTTAAQPNITSVGTLSTLTVNAVTYANTDGTNGQVLTTYGNGITYWSTVTGGGGGGASISNGTSNVNIATVDGNVTVGVAGNANILTITGTGVNVSGTSNTTGNLSAGNISTGGVLSVTGNANVGNLGTAGSIIGRTLESNVAQGTAPIIVASTTKVTNLNADLLDGYDTATAATANTVVVRDANADITAANIIGTQGRFSANVTSPVLISNVSTGTAPLTVTSTTRVANLNVSHANVADLISISDVNTGTYYPILANAATGNVSEGSNANLSFNAATGALSTTSLTTTGKVTMGTVQYANTDGTNGQVLTTYGNGITYWATAAGGGGASISNGTSNINIATSDGNITAGVGGTANVLILTTTGANITGTFNATGNANVGNIGAAAGVFTGNVTSNGQQLTTTGKAIAMAIVFGG
jgi:hypothetical protein